MSATDELRRLLDGRGVEYLTYGTSSQTAWITERPSAGNGWQATFASVHEKPTTHSMLLYWKVTPEQAVEATLGRGTCHAESDLSEWVCSACQCWIPLGLTPENIQYASEWRYCPHCGAEVKAVSDDER